MDQSRVALFEERPVPSAVVTLAVPTIISSLVMVLYNLADTYFVGMLNDPVRKRRGVALAAPVLLAFNAVTNLFGVGSVQHDEPCAGSQRPGHPSRAARRLAFTVRLPVRLLFSLGYTVFHAPLLAVLGADATTFDATAEYLFWTVTCGAPPAILNVIMAYLVRAEGATMHASVGTMSGWSAQHRAGPVLYHAVGLWHGRGRGGAGDLPFQLRGMRVLLCALVCAPPHDLRLY